MANLKTQNVYLWIIGYLVGVVALFFYSFTQIDLSLTLSRASWVQQFEKSFQYIGYFQRPLSTYLFIGSIVLLFFFYIQLLRKFRELTTKQVWLLIFFSAVLLGIAYNAFSYDLFNYIFDAKIFTHYHQNPYEHKALDYAAAGEPMLSFMRWTHRNYPYGPIWLLITIPLSYVGMNYFLLTFFIFKACMVSAYLGTAWLIKKIVQETKFVDEKFALLFFGLNPFMLIESVVSAHVDIVMMFFMMGGVYFLVKKRFFFAFIGLVLSYGVKFASSSYPLSIHIAVVLAFVLGLFVFSKIQKKLSWDIWFTLLGVFMILPVVLASLRANFQPWYLLSLFPFFAVISNKKYILIPAVFVSFSVLFEYVPYLYIGNWDPPIPVILLSITAVTSAIALCLSIFFFVKKHE